MIFFEDLIESGSISYFISVRPFLLLITSSAFFAQKKITAFLPTAWISNIN